MKKTNIFSLALALASLSFSTMAYTSARPVTNGNGQHLIAHRRTVKRRRDAAQAVTYTCPMHDDVHMKSPGVCPKCGMELEAERSDRQKSQH